MELSDAQFEAFVREGIERIPERFRREMENVVFLIEDEPSAEKLRENGVPLGGALLGLYEGIPLTERGSLYGDEPTLPDTITIYKKPTLDMAGSDVEAVRTIVIDTVWHEVAHYFGMEEDEVEARERTGTNRSSADGSA